MIGTAIFASTCVVLYWYTKVLGGEVNFLTGLAALATYAAIYFAEARK